METSKVVAITTVITFFFSALVGGQAWVKAQITDSPTPGRVIGEISFADPNWRTKSHVLKEGAWQSETLSQVIVDPVTRSKLKVLKTFYPKTSSSPASSRNFGTPLGGEQFAADFNLLGRKAMGLDYYVYFPEDFAFNKGGKLPGLYGGSVSEASGGRHSSDSFSTRLMWRKDGQGELYVYFPNPDVADLGIKSGDYGVSIGRNTFTFRPGTWTHVRQLVQLTNSKNDHLQIWINDMSKPVIDIKGVKFNQDTNLLANGLYFSTFFGGSDSSWASPKAQYLLFTGFRIWEPNATK